MKSRKKRLLVLGGSYCADAIKKFANEYNVQLVVAGNSPNAPIVKIADEYYNVNSTDAEEMKKIINALDIDGIYLGSSEPVISSAISYVKECGFPCYCTKKQWETIQNKALLKEAFIEHGLPVVQRYNISLEQIDEMSDKIKFPVITKPSDGCGSNGFSVCYDVEGLKKGYIAASENSYSGEVIIEDFVNNKGLVAFFSFSNGKMFFLGAEDKYPRKYISDGGYVAGLLVFESALREDFEKKFCHKLERMFKSLGISEGTIWIEVFCNGEEYYFNEAGYRYGGSGTVYPIDYLYGVNQVYADMLYALEGKSELYGHTSLLPTTVPRKKHYCIYPIYVNSGTIKAIEGIDTLKNMENVVNVILTKGIGDVVPKSGGFSQNIALVHFLADSSDEIASTITFIHKTLRVLGANEEDILAPSFEF